MKTSQRFAFLFTCAAALISHSALAQVVQQGPKLVGADVMGYAATRSAVALSADGNTAIVGGFDDNNTVGAAWVFTRSGGVWTQQGTKLVGSGAIGNAQQGFSAALSADGNTAMIGGIGDNGNMGAAWVFTRNAGSWSQQGAKLTGSDALGTPQQGYSVSLSADGNTALIGGPFDSPGGASWVWIRSGGVWIQDGTKLKASGTMPGDRQGYSVSLSGGGDTAIIGAEGDDSYAGAAWVWARSGGVWTQQGAKLVGAGAIGKAHQGSSLSLSADGNTAIVGGPNDDGTLGAAWVWTRGGGVWTQQGNKLVALAGSQGSSVSLSSDGNTAIIGGPYNNVVFVGNCTCGTGAAWIWTRSGGVWTQRSKLVGSDGLGGGQGSSVGLSADGNTAIIGGPLEGAAWVFIMDPAALPTVSLWALAALAATLAFLGIVRARN